MAEIERINGRSEQRLAESDCYLYHIIVSGRVAAKGITRHKSDGENELKAHRAIYGEAEIEWFGPADYSTVRKWALEGFS